MNIEHWTSIKIGSHDRTKSHPKNSDFVEWIRCVAKTASKNTINICKWSTFASARIDDTPYFSNGQWLWVANFHISRARPGALIIIFAFRLSFYRTKEKYKKRPKLVSPIGNVDVNFIITNQFAHLASWPISRHIIIEIVIKHSTVDIVRYVRRATRTKGVEKNLLMHDVDWSSSKPTCQFDIYAK